MLEELRDPQNKREPALMHRLMRKLAGTGLIAKKRYGNTLQGVNMNAEEWTQLLQQPGGQGGL